MYRVALVVALIGAFSMGLIAERVPREPIIIASDRDFTAENGVVSGRGIQSDPYVISGWRIHADHADYGIHIRGTARPFVIRDVEIIGARQVGIYLVSTRFGRLQGIDIQGCGTGLALHLTRDISVRDLHVRQCDDGVRLWSSTELRVERITIEDCREGLSASWVAELVVRDSIFRACDLGVRLGTGIERVLLVGNSLLACRIPALSDGGGTWDDGTRGNYWEGLTAELLPGGILNTVVKIPNAETDKDRFPLAAPPR